MRGMVLAASFALAGLPGLAAAQTAPAVYSTTKTPLGKLMADPQAKAVLVKHIPMMGQNNPDAGPGSGALEQASEMTLKELSDATKAYTGDMFSDKVLTAIDADLAKLTPAK